MSEMVTENPQLTANDMVTAKEMADTLHSHYPGHMWAVTCNGATGMASIRNLLLSGNLGIQLRLPANYTASDFRRRVVILGGELLDRFGMPRGAFDQDRYNQLPRDERGNLKVHMP